MSLRKKHITICRDCLNFMNCIEYSFLFIRSIENIFMTGVRSVPFTVHRQTVSGAVGGIGSGDENPQEVLKLINEYGISAD